MDIEFFDHLHNFYSQTAAQSILDIDYSKYEIKFSENVIKIEEQEENDDWFSFLIVILENFQQFLNKNLQQRQIFTTEFQKYLFKFLEYVVKELNLLNLIIKNISGISLNELATIRVFKLLDEFETKIICNLKKENVLEQIQQLYLFLLQQIPRFLLTNPLFKKIETKLLKCSKYFQYDSNTIYKMNKNFEDLSIEEEEEAIPKQIKSFSRMNFEVILKNIPKSETSLSSEKNSNTSRVEHGNDSAIRLLNLNEIYDNDDDNSFRLKIPIPMEESWYIKENVFSKKKGSNFNYNSPSKKNSKKTVLFFDTKTKQNKNHVKNNVIDKSNEVIEINGVKFLNNDIKYDNDEISLMEDFLDENNEEETKFLFENSPKNDYKNDSPVIQREDFLKEYADIESPLLKLEHASQVSYDFRLETDIPETVLRETEQLKAISQMCSGERRIESTLNYATNETIKFSNKNQNFFEKKNFGLKKRKHKKHALWKFFKKTFFVFLDAKRTFMPDLKWDNFLSKNIIAEIQLVKIKNDKYFMHDGNNKKMLLKSRDSIFPKNANKNFGLNLSFNFGI